ncbi:MAG: FHA domain-containing protein [Opitutae bacterium]|nr:FHA domain-containing protein [Opitutae bacterium]
MARLDEEWLAEKGRTLRPTVPSTALYDRLKFVAGIVADAPAGVVRGPCLLWRGEHGEVRACGLPEKLVIGRAADCDLTLSSPRVSRRHCEVTMLRGVAWVSDLGSANGTFHNSRRLGAPAPLRDGDVIEVGGRVIVFVA